MQQERLIKFTKYLFGFMFYSGIVVVLALPFILNLAGKYVSSSYEKLYIPMLIIYGAAGVCALVILHRLRQMIKTVINQDCFVDNNVSNLYVMGKVSTAISFLFIPASNEPKSSVLDLGDCREGQIPRSSLRYKLDAPLLAEGYLTVKLLFFPTAATLVIILTFFVAGIFSHALGCVFYEAVRCKEENDLTIYEHNQKLTTEDMCRIIAIFRFLVPGAFIRLAGGRGLMEDKGRLYFLSGANAAITGDMTTTMIYHLSKQTGLERVSSLARCSRE